MSEDAVTTMASALEDATDAILLDVPVAKESHRGRSLLILVLVLVGLAAAAYFIKRSREEQELASPEVVDIAAAEDAAAVATRTS